MMETARYWDTWMALCQTVHHIQEYGILNSYRRENLKSDIKNLYSVIIQ
jgi:hypothetical protein